MLQIDMTEAKVFHSMIDDVAVVLIGTNRKLTDEEMPLKFDTSVNKRPTILETEKYIEVLNPGNAHIISVDTEATRPLSEIKIANDVYLMGYPMSLRLQNENLFDYSKPLLRKGIIAGTNPTQNTFIIDCSSYYGNSGGPIIEYGEDDYFRVIGLVSRYIPFVTEWINPREQITHKENSNSGYTICVPMNAVYNLIDSQFKQD